ncbi:hypothetical protein RP20_CCG019435 [Aedes albopictus]|nr:hypothetical protein RP20_CCG019435 [Aedes albopictus]
MEKGREEAYRRGRYDPSDKGTCEGLIEPIIILPSDGRRVGETGVLRRGIKIMESSLSETHRPIKYACGNSSNNSGFNSSSSYGNNSSQHSQSNNSYSNNSNSGSANRGGSASGGANLSAFEQLSSRINQYQQQVMSEINRNASSSGMMLPNPFANQIPYDYNSRERQNSGGGYQGRGGFQQNRGGRNNFGGNQFGQRNQGGQRFNNNFNNGGGGGNRFGQNNSGGNRYNNRRNF